MDSLLQRIWERKLAFFGTFFVVFTFSYLILLAIDFVPEPPAERSTATTTTPAATTAAATTTASTTAPESATLPIATTSSNTAQAPAAAVPVSTTMPREVVIEKLDKRVAVLNPASRKINDLDAALLEGAVRHPDSATLDQEGNVFILGHSSYLPNVLNRNFQAFNGIQNLEWGDEITVYADDAVYTYLVEKVYRARAQDVTVPIAGTGKMLTLATCNSFGSVDDRYIVEAKQVARTAR